MQRSKVTLLPMRWLWFDKVLLALVAIVITLAASIITLLVSTKLLVLAIAAIPLLVCLCWLIAARRYEWVVAIALVVSILIDWHQLIAIRFPIFSTAIALLTCIAVLLQRLPGRSLPMSYHWLLWGVLLILAAPPILWAVLMPEAMVYYLQIFFTPMLLFILGTLIGQHSSLTRRMFGIIALIAALIAIHTIIAALTGVFLLETAATRDYLSSVNNFALGDGANRVGSFLRNPDWNGTFLAMLVFLPIGLLVSTPSRLARLFYLAEISAILLALLFTYSTAAWLSLGAGMLALVLLSARRARHAWFAILLFATIGAIFVVFPHQRAVFLEHLTDSQDARLRLGAWETALRVILANPFNGVGLGLTSYVERAEPYRVPLQYIPLSHPHDTYLEIAALAGLPTLLAFLALLGTLFWQAFKNWRRVAIQARPLYAAALAAMIAFSFNSLTINGWTLPPLAAFAWLILAVIAAPVGAHSAYPCEEKDNDGRL